ncbi:MAG TPA: YsnF/AvaK domain-containing protein [Acidobacteriaceae bacterium]|nr:YsnF/AvaK domain-containing protein [Acidobacteriaceae bacterium]
MFRDRTHRANVIIGIFPYASNARRALNILHQHQFSEPEVDAAFRDPDSARKTNSPAVLNLRTGQWFAHLRQFYYGGDHKENNQEDSVSQGTNPAELTTVETALAQIDLSEQDERTLERDLSHGAAIVTVRAGARNPEARWLLEEAGAHIIHGYSPEPAAPIPQYDPVTVTSSPFNPPPQADPGHVLLFGEALRVRKEKVSKGEVNVRKEAVTHMETVQVPVTREQLVVEQSDGNGHADAENSIRVPLSEERVHIDKEPVLREEYKVGKREVTQNETVRDSVRRERLLIDDPGVREKG